MAGECSDTSTEFDELKKLAIVKQWLFFLRYLVEKDVELQGQEKLRKCRNCGDSAKQRSLRCYSLTCRRST